jgi:hypothetical protein
MKQKHHDEWSKSSKFFKSAKSYISDENASNLNEVVETRNETQMKCPKDGGDRVD